MKQAFSHWFWSVFLSLSVVSWVSGQNVDGQNVDGQNVDNFGNIGQNVDGKNVDGKKKHNNHR